MTVVETTEPVVECLFHVIGVHVYNKLYTEFKNKKAFLVRVSRLFVLQCVHRVADNLDEILTGALFGTHSQPATVYRC